MRKRIKISHNPERGYYVDLPTYHMIPGTWKPISAGKIHPDGCSPNATPADILALNPTVECDIPDELMSADGNTIDAVKITKLYRDHPRWRDPDKPPRV